MCNPTGLMIYHGRCYTGIVSELMHFNVESPDQLQVRLADVDRPKKTIQCPKNENDDPYLHRF